MNRKRDTDNEGPTLRSSLTLLPRPAGALLFGGIVLAGCARPMSPSGGPRDIIPPMVASTWPDTFAAIEPTRDPVRITFSERISERPTQGTLDNAVLVSPVTGAHRVKHTRSGLEVNVIGGFKPDLVYRIRVLPTVRDLFNNSIEGPFELVFSTGAPFETNVVAGMAKERITGEAAPNIRVEARDSEAEDPPVYVAVTDSAGVFALRYLPAGSYQISLYQDNNRNGRADFAELQGDTLGVLGAVSPAADTVLFRQVSLLRPDTTPARLIRVEAVDSLLVRLAFDDYLDAEGSLEAVRVMIAPEAADTVGGGRLPVVPEPGDTAAAAPPPEPQETRGPLRWSRILWPRQVDSLRAAEDSLAAAERRLAVVDSLGAVGDSLSRVLRQMRAEGDTLGVDTLETRLEAIRRQMAPPEPPPAPTRPELTEPPPILPQQEIFVLLADSLAPNQLYKVTVSRVTNINGVEEGGGETRFSWEPPERVEEEADTVGAGADTLGVPPDTGRVVPPDTGRVVPPDTLAVPPDRRVTPPAAGRILPPVLSTATAYQRPWRRRP